MFCWRFPRIALRTLKMSNADPFREIVKNNAHLYRDSEEQRELNAAKKAKEYKEWKKANENKIKKDDKVVDSTKNSSKMVSDEGRG